MKGISVVICCYNSESRIIPTLTHLSEQKFTQPIKWEVILVNNASTDKTSSVAQKTWDACDTTIPLHIVDEPQAGLSYARKKGIETSKYDLIIFCDDDNWLCNDYLNRAVTIMNENSKVAICGGRGEFITDDNFVEPDWLENHKRGFATGIQGRANGEVFNEKKWVYGAGMILRKSVFYELEEKGFKSRLVDRKGNSLSSGGDVEFCYAVQLMGYKIIHNPALKFKHYMPSGRLNWDYIKRLQQAGAVTNLQLAPYKKLLIDKSIETNWVKLLRKVFERTLKLWWRTRKIRRKNIYSFEALQYWRNKSRLQYLLKNKSNYDKSFAEVNKMLENFKK